MQDLSVVKQALLPEAAGLVLDQFIEMDGLMVVETHDLRIRSPHGLLLGGAGAYSAV